MSCRSFACCICAAVQNSLYGVPAGFLHPRRVQKLNELGVSWQPIRTDADILWDARLTQLLSFRREHGRVQVRS